MNKINQNHIGTNFDDFLQKVQLLDEVIGISHKHVLSMQIKLAMEKKHITKAEMAKKMHTSRAALNRLLDESDTSLTLITLASAAAVLGKSIKFELKAA